MIWVFCPCQCGFQKKIWMGVGGWGELYPIFFWIFVTLQSPLPYVERSSSAVERRTRNRASPGSNPPLPPFRRLGIFILSTTPQFTQLYKWVPGYRQWWTCEWIVVARICCMARMLPGEAELVSEWTGLPGEEKCEALWAVQMLCGNSVAMNIDRTWTVTHYLLSGPPDVNWWLRGRRHVREEEHPVFRRRHADGDTCEGEVSLRISLPTRGLRTV